MNKPAARPFFGTTTDLNAAFPSIEELEFSVSQDPYGYYLRDAWQRTQRYTKGNLPPDIRCANPRCRQGGLPTQQIVLFHPDGEFTFSCHGHEGTPAGRRKGDPCDNRFAVTLKVTRAASAAVTPVSKTD